MFYITDIVLLSEKNAEELSNIEKLCFSQPWSVNMFLGDLKSENTVYFGAYEDKILVGYIGMWDVVQSGDITNVAVHPDYRRNGIGSKLISKLIEYCENKGISEINLEVRESNNAILLYEKFGFQKVGMRKNYYKNPKEDAILMRKDILR